MDTAHPTKPLTSRTWLLAFAGSVLLAVLLHLLLVWRLDVYGIWRDPHGRALSTGDHERKAKYLLNGQYVPANFNSLIVGGSSSMNWQLGELGSYHFYNESLEGGNSSEERLLASHALENGHFRLAIMGLNPHITLDHALVDGLDTVSRTETLGSISALDLELRALLGALRHSSGSFYPDGGHDMPAEPPPSLRQDWTPMSFQLDAQSVADYQALAQTFQSRGVKLVYVVYPILGPYYRANQAGMEQYVQHMRSVLPAAPLIDFNTPEYRAFCDDPTNFIDEVHLSAKGSATLMPMLRNRLNQALTP